MTFLFLDINMTDLNEEVAIINTCKYFLKFE